MLNLHFIRKVQLTVAILLFTMFQLQAQQYAANWESLNKRKIPEWFHQDKFGIFIHWGLYAVPSYSLVIPDGYSEWYWCNYNDTSRHNHKAVKSFHDKIYGKDFTYDQFAPQFKAELFDPVQWANIFKNSGAKYVVLTSKHHEGFALWPSKEADASWGRTWNAVTTGPKRDVLGDLTTAVRNAGLKMGFYYSLLEWYNPLYLKNPAEYVDKVMMPQFKDLVTRYKPSVIFSDGEWVLEDTAWRSPELLAWLFNESPVKKDIVVNDRWGRNTRKKHAATYYTSEYGSGLDKNVVWEESRGMGESYGYNRVERLADYKTGNELILILTDIVCKGGNLLLDIGPAADGTIPVIMEDRLTQMGNWLAVNGEAIFGTTAHTTEKQWSSGQRPSAKKGEYQTGYDVNELVKKRTDGKAFVEMFFTRKGKQLYCIVPEYNTTITIRNVKPLPSSSIEILGSGRQIPWKQVGKDVICDLSRLTPADLQHPIFTIKVSAAGDN
ncbi:MAG: alpha-L-fucosidase [Chitinophagaceae bacterium]|nr:alpha-L-fucosidase [Chitinophagaceae bacterium]